MSKKGGRPFTVLSHNLPSKEGGVAYGRDFKKVSFEVFEIINAIASVVNAVVAVVLLVRGEMNDRHQKSTPPHQG